MKHIRYSKIALVGAIAFFVTLVAFNNITDFGSNEVFVFHILSMDTTFPDNDGMWRAIDSQTLHIIAYVIIIATELAIAALCWIGGIRLWKAVRDPKAFDKAKGLAVIGLTLGILLWFTGFMTVGGEWFLMWQSKTWNGQQAAFRLTAVFGIVLVYLAMPDGIRDHDSN